MVLTMLGGSENLSERQTHYNCHAFIGCDKYLLAMATTNFYMNTRTSLGFTGVVITSGVSISRTRYYLAEILILMKISTRDPMAPEEPGLLRHLKLVLKNI